MDDSNKTQKTMITDPQTGLMYETCNIKQNLSITDQIQALQNCKVYISGKITGIHARAKKDFAKAEAALIAKGLTPVNPFKFNHNHDKSWENYMRICIIELMKCDAIYMLPNWRKSKGAIIEFHLAVKLNLMVITDTRTLYEKKTEFAIKLGYQNIAAAISEMGAYTFNSEFQNT